MDLSERLKESTVARSGKIDIRNLDFVNIFDKQELIYEFRVLLIYFKLQVVEVEGVVEGAVEGVEEEVDVWRVVQLIRLAMLNKVIVNCFH